jgi:hypothetical protein
MIHVTDRSTGKTVKAKGGKNAALIVSNALDRQWYERNIESRNFPPDSEELKQHEKAT